MVERRQELYAEALQVHPENTGLLLDAARCNYIICNHTQEARRLFQRAYVLQPSRCSVVLAYAEFIDSVDGAGPESARLYQVPLAARLLAASTHEHMLACKQLACTNHGTRTHARTHMDTD